MSYRKKKQYMQEFKTRTRRRDVVWNFANGVTYEVKFPGVEFSVVSQNDLMLSSRRYGSLINVGAILGVEIKKKLSWKGLRQTEAEFYVWSNDSIFPFIQLITDTERGGVALYSKGGELYFFRIQF